MAEIRLATVLNLKPDDVGKGFVATVRLRERDDNVRMSYCENEESFHERYFHMRNCLNAKDDGISLCFLEMTSNLWLLTKAIQRKEGHLTEVFREFFGRLMVKFHKKNHCGTVNLKRQLDKMKVHSILDRKYSYFLFTGYDQVRIDFRTLQKIVELDLSDWRKALCAISAIYLISDKNKGGAYVGSAYGEDGLWGRWSVYASGKFMGNGNDRGVEERIGGNPQYASNFEFSILEVLSKKKQPKEIIERENWWKDTLRTRKSHNNNGMNLN